MNRKGILFRWIYTCILLLLSLKTVFADDRNRFLRWVGNEDPDGSVAHVIQNINEKLGQHFTEKDFLLQEDRDLAFNHYKRLVQVLDQTPIHGKSIRIWTELNSEKAIQVEAALELSRPRTHSIFSIQSMKKTVEQLQREMSTAQTMALARESIQSDPDDSKMLGAEWKDEWKNGNLVRAVKARGQRGYHYVNINLLTQEVISHEYREFPQGDVALGSEFEIPVQVYPIYEEFEGGKGRQLPRIPATLGHLYKEVPRIDGDIYGPLKKNQHYYDVKMDPVLGQTPAGRAMGYWSMNQIKEEAEKIRRALPAVPNDFVKGVLLQGLYENINIHPDAYEKFGPFDFQPEQSPPFFPTWIAATFGGRPVQEMIPSQAYSGKPIRSLDDAWNRPVRRLSDHDPKQYISDGFDEIQVYYAINTLFESLRARGFTDPELSTRPFNAFLYNPDIKYRDNAFYTDDTINFTTYSPHAVNFARDNSTIWHELGHGVMDRLMGDNIDLADTGGLSEGMADFIAALVIQAVTGGSPFPGSDKFRIINNTGFFLTNEVHDDGEAYGGSMRDFLEAVMRQNPKTGLDKVVDVVLEAMRLSRDYPGLTASDWFQHILFADSLGRPGVREPNELKPFLLTALAGRNFRMDSKKPALFSILNLDTKRDVVAGSPGSRDRPIRVNIGKDETADFRIQAVLQNSDEYSFHFPVQVRVEYEKGALQGAIHWIGKEKGPQIYTLKSETDTLTIPLRVSGTCDAINRQDGSCVDYAYIQIWNQGEQDHPVAKKRFYLKIRNS